ncbi:hypothetical protein P886_1267 [Alteromonadaceae bacterium 2753L.S.0a.02]|nr:hypothetical protein P886_2005 [Alteromonadaceae bacterium 2753L.S.0a.02]TVZ41916.1 hypothetical protein P886_1267 [Alteromonadaceae bacterium 2753L.S.0a.02]
MRSMKITIFVLLLVIVNYGLACSPMMPLSIPPINPYGEFEYIHPPTHEESFLAQLKSAKDVTVFKANLVWASKKNGREYSEIELLHGWGSQRGRLKQLHRENYFCGEFVNLKEGKWYVGIMENGLPYDILEYERAKEELSKRGEPEYVFTAIGLLK